MIGPEFASCFLKIGRAEEHFNRVKAELTAWKNTNPYVVTRKRDTDGTRHSLVVDISKPPPLDHWALLTGDCVHNLRSALDSAVYALAVKESGSNPPPNFDALQFPITDAPKKFAGQVKRRLTLLSTQAQARIERAQPYNRRHRELPPLLWLLGEFDNIDKHRLLNVVVANMGEGKFSFEASSRIVVPAPVIPARVSFHVGPIESGTECAYFTLRTPQPDVNYKYELTFVISVGHSVGPSKRKFGELAHILDILITEVKTVVDSVVS